MLNAKTPDCAIDFWRVGAAGSDRRSNVGSLGRLEKSDLLELQLSNKSSRDAPANRRYSPDDAKGVTQPHRALLPCRFAVAAG